MKKKSDRYVVIHSQINEIIEFIQLVLKESTKGMPLENPEEILADIKYDLVQIAELLRRKNTRYRNDNGKRRAKRF